MRSIPCNARDALCLAILVALVWVTHHGVLRCELVNYDDPGYIKDNPKLALGISPPGLYWGLTTFYFSNWHPLTWWSYLLDYQMHGLDATALHLGNLLWHTGSTLLLFIALRRLTGAVWPSALTAALFAVHPLNVEAVAWVSERKGVISTFFWMLTLWCYARYVERPRTGAYILVAASLALGLMAKQMLVTLPCVLLLLDYWPLARWQRSARPARLVLEKLPLFALCLAAALLTIVAQSRSGAAVSLEAVPLAARLGNAVWSYVAYLGQAAWPVSLAAFYPHSYGSLATWQIVLASLALLAVTGLALALARRAPYVLVGWLWYVGTLVPVIGLVQLGRQARADRYCYVAMVGVFIMAAWSLQALGRRAPRMAFGLAAGAMAVLMVLGARQGAVWHDSVTLWQHAIAVTGGDAGSYYSLGAALALHDEDAAMAQYWRAFELDPSYAEAHLQAGMILLRRQDYGAAATHLRKALRLPEVDRNLAVAHYHLGLALLRQGQRAEASFHFREALRLDPADELAHVNLGIICKDLGDLAGAVEHLQRAVALDDSLVVGHFQLGIAHSLRGDFQAAVASLRRAAALRPMAETQRELAFALHGAGALDQARANYRESLQLDASWPEAVRREAWRLATSGAGEQGARALQLARQVVQATGSNEPLVLDTLAAACAAAGQFAEAVAVAELAATRARASGDGDRAAAIDERRRLYAGQQRFIAPEP